MKSCTRCGNTHIGCLIFATAGFRCLFASDWEQRCSEKDLEFQLRNQIPLIKPPSNTLRFITLAN